MKKCFYFLTVFLALGCEQDQVPIAENDDTQIKATILTKQEVIDHNHQVKVLLSGIEGSDNKFISKSSDNVENFKVLEDQVKFLEYQDYHSYTFGIIRKNSQFILENLLLTLRHDGSYESYLVLYDISENEKRLLMEGRGLDLSNKIFFQKINFDSSEIMNKSSNTLEGAINECPSGYCCEIVREESQATGWDIYVSKIISCPSDDQPSNGGGSGGGGGPTYPDPTGPGSDPYPTGGITQGYVNQQGEFVANLTSPVTDREEPTYPDGSTSASEFLSNTLYPLSTDQENWIYNTDNNAEVAQILDFLSSEGRNEETIDFVRAAIEIMREGGIIDFDKIEKALDQNSNSFVNNYSVNDFPGKNLGFIFEWWKSESFIKTSGFFNLAIDLPTAPSEDPNSMEIALFGLFPAAAIAHIENSQTALNKSAELVLNGTLTGIEDGKADAFRHAFWNALGTAEFGGIVMKLFADAHEWKKAGLAVEMDLFNNQKGRDIGLGFNFSDSDDIIEYTVMEALQNGELKYINSNILVPTDQ